MLLEIVGTALSGLIVGYMTGFAHAVWWSHRQKKTKDRAWFSPAATRPTAPPNYAPPRVHPTERLALQIDRLEAEALADFPLSGPPESLEAFRTKYLGLNGRIRETMRSVAQATGADHLSLTKRLYAIHTQLSDEYDRTLRIVRDETRPAGK